MPNSSKTELKAIIPGKAETKQIQDLKSAIKKSVKNETGNSCCQKCGTDESNFDRVEGSAYLACLDCGHL